MSPYRSPAATVRRSVRWTVGDCRGQIDPEHWAARACVVLDVADGHGGSQPNASMRWLALSDAAVFSVAILFALGFALAIAMTTGAP